MKLHPARSFLFGCVLAWLGSGCSGTPAPEPAPPGDAPPAPTAGVDVPPAADREEMSAADCEAKGGSVVGDIGDGAVHRPDYKCPSGSPPIGRVPSGIEGSVCCK
jgi:hypothetical protein